jgi:hypothetical protein
MRIQDLALPKSHAKRRAQNEYVLAVEVAIRLKRLESAGKLSGMWFHVPNECVVRTKSDLIRLQRKKDMGMRNGAPDLAFLKPDGCLQVELKTEKGKLSDSQKAWRDYSLKQDIPYVVARSWKDVKNALVEYGFVAK